MSVVAKATCRIAGKRPGTMIIKGKVYDDNSPVVKARPELFESAEDYQKRTAKPRGTPDLGGRSMSARRLRRTSDAVETARQAPGEKRAMDYPCDVDGCKGHTSQRAATNHAKRANG